MRSCTAYNTSSRRPGLHPNLRPRPHIDPPHVMARSLIVLPDDSARPILDAIEAARRSLRIKMFLFSDPSLLAAVVAARKRGLKVRVMLNPARRSGEAENEASRKQLLKARVDVLDSNPAFDLTHEKSMVVDETS